MARKREERLLEHAVDGIREYDNPTPGWWHAIFLGTIGLSFVYAAFFHTSELAWTPHSVLADQRARYYQRLFADLGELQPDQATMVSLMGDERWMAFGSSVFSANCAQCHGSEGTGINGPNLTDDHWISVREMPDIVRIVTDGVSAKGMPGWGARLSENERILVSAYVASLRTAPKPGRDPEGEVVPAWNAAP